MLPNTLPLTVQLALTLASLCECGHLENGHDANGCRFCPSCTQYHRRTTNDALAREVLG